MLQWQQNEINKLLPYIVYIYVAFYLIFAINAYGVFFKETQF